MPPARGLAARTGNGFSLVPRVDHMGRALQNAAQCNETGRLAVLLERSRGLTSVGADSSGAPMVTWRNEAGADALLIGAAHGQAAAVDMLLQNGASVNSTNFFGHSPLISAAYNGQVAAVQALLKRGADTTMRDKDGTALDNGAKRLLLLLQQAPRHPQLFLAPFAL